MTNLYMILGIEITNMQQFIFFMQRNLDFKLKVIGGDISAVPGISDAIEVNYVFFFICSAY